MNESHMPQPTTFPANIRPDACSVELDFGRHAGRTLGQLARRDPTYLRWLVRQLAESRPDVAEAAAEVRAWVRNGGVL